MAAQKVQAYLEKHRIGALFEDLMASVISDMPEEPIPFLIRSLKKVHTQSNGGSKDFGSLPPSRAKSSFAKSMGLSGVPISRQTLDEGRDHRSALAKSWSGPDAYLEGSKYKSTSGSKVHSREYPRPWLSGSKSASLGIANKDNTRPTSKTSHSQNGQERPPWNAKTAVPSRDFDEWFAMQRRPQRSGNEPLRHYQGASSWGGNGELDIPNERMVSYYRRTAPPVPSSCEGDSGLDEELYEGKDIKARDEENDQSSLVSYESSRQGKLKARHAAEEHRQQLQALLMDKDQRRAGRNKFNDVEDLHDDGAELLENVDELESEGVANISNRGTRISKSMRRGTETSESVRVSICARCAKVITGQPSERKSDVASVYSAGSDVDDNFESVSQVGSTARLGRPPVWPSGFDSENDSSPRDGHHMWQSPSRSLVKGRHMFRGGSFTAEQPDSSRPPTASSSRSDLVLPGKQQQSWNAGGYSSDNDTEVNFDRVESKEFAGGRPWNRATLESGSETDWDTRPERRIPRRGFAAQFDSDEESD